MTKGRLVTVLSLLVLAACSSASNAKNDDKGDGGVPTAPMPTPSTSAQADSGPPILGSGQIRVQRKVTFDNFGRTTSVAITAAFVTGTTPIDDLTMAANGLKCSKTPIDACVVSDCVLATPDAPETQKLPTAGTLTISASSDLTVTPDSMGAYSFEKEGELFAQDQEIKIKATGAEVPAFEKSLRSPVGMTLNAPIPADGETSVTVDRTQPLVFDWNGGGNRVVAALVQANETNQAFKFLTCEFDGPSHKGTIPPAALAKLDVGTASITMGSASTLDFDVNGWKIEAVVQSGTTIEVQGDVK